MASLLLTGFPGLLGSELLARLLARDDDATAVCLVRGRSAAAARAHVLALTDPHPRLMGRIRLVEADITQAGLGVSPVDAALLGETTEVYHVAALRDPRSSRERAMRVNVGGTRAVLAAAERMPRLERFHYLSTCLVSGRHEGHFTEDDLDRRQRFNDWHEESRYLAEVEVQIRMMNGLPATIYRPAIVAGDMTGRGRPRSDGPYYVIRSLLRQPAVAFLPVPRAAMRWRPNVVPRDYVVGAIAWLGALGHSRGKVYQLADPRPPTLAEAIGLIAEATGRRVVRVPVPGSGLRRTIARLPGGARLGLPPEAIAYYERPALYTTSEAQADLAGSGLSVPPFEAYVDKLVDQVRRHPPRQSLVRPGV